MTITTLTTFVNIEHNIVSIENNTRSLLTLCIIQTFLTLTIGHTNYSAVQISKQRVVKDKN